MKRDADHELNNGWQQCPPGEVTELVGRLRARRRHQTFRQVALGTAALCLVLIAGTSLVHRVTNHPAEPSSGSITCADVTKHAEAYAAGTLDEEMVRRIDSHLGECSFCRDLIQRMKEQSDSAPVVRKETAQLSAPRLIAQSD